MVAGFACTHCMKYSNREIFDACTHMCILSCLPHSEAKQSVSIVSLSVSNQCYVIYICMVLSVFIDVMWRFYSLLTHQFHSYCSLCVVKPKSRCEGRL